MSVNRIKAKIVVENQRVGTANLRGDGPTEAIIPAIRNCRTSNQIVSNPHFGDVLIKVGHGSLAQVPGARPERKRSTRTCCLSSRIDAVFLRSVYIRALRLDLQASGTPAGAQPMWIMVVYVLIVVVCELIVVGIGLALDRIAPIASLPVSLTLFFAVLWFGWLLAVRWTESKHGKKSKLVTEN
jgi:hypothetical protein